MWRDDVLRHPADVEGWKHFDSKFLEFASDLRNIRLGLASYEFNLFGQMSTSYGIWPVMLLSYNLPPWKFLVRCLKWADVGREYIEVVKGNLQEQSRTNKATRQKQSYNHSSGSKSFLQQQHELAEKKGKSINRVKLFRETYVRAEMFVLQVAEDAHNQMLELQSQLPPEDSRLLSGDEICDLVLGRRPGYLKGFGWGPKPKVCKTMSASSSTTSCPQSTEKEIELQAKLNEALEQIEVQYRNYQALSSKVQQMRKLIQDLTQAQQGPPHNPQLCDTYIYICLHYS
ncbi:CACTA en-spm transposon protein [Cucumis melo var. makuwa]|uniref:CACTA en-spm transposon protein n=1 Tax=Cucumis melo var. makuwa TaxID=1194695 RepID=A0A5A7UG35_CUCMM|nr:CACTA en-spm transposon protein [Cucumis melo var. makuwa]TYK20683.1 CACTA en-spm transposon protein [Cucumis melo var. makuwa]